MNFISFRVPAIPVAQPRQRHRLITTKTGNQFVNNFTPAKHPVQDFKATVRHACREAYAGAPLDVPIELRVVFIMPRPGRLIWKTKPMPRERHCSKPDIDNLLKSLKDALNEIAWRDDGQIFRVDACKMYAAGDEQPCVEVEILSGDCANSPAKSGPTLFEAVGSGSK